MQQNQRVENGWLGSFSSTPSYSLICIGWPQRGQASPSPGMTIDFFRLRFALNAPPPILGYRKHERPQNADRKSTRLNSSHPSISYAVFCLKKKKKKKQIIN